MKRIIPEHKHAEMCFWLQDRALFFEAMSLLLLASGILIAWLVPHPFNGYGISLVLPAAVITAIVALVSDNGEHSLVYHIAFFFEGILFLVVMLGGSLVSAGLRIFFLIGMLAIWWLTSNPVRHRY